jgi:hypothetical protein
MKILSIILILSLFTVIACNDEFMEKYPLDKISDQNYWQSTTDVELYTNQFYPYIGGWLNAVNSDDHVYRSRHQYLWNEYVAPQTGGGWAKTDWLQISRCNFALVRMANMEKNALIKVYEGEIRFFRAYFYHDKIKLFGDVPWLEKDLQTNSEELFKARDSRKVVFAHILEDLDFAIANLPITSGSNRLTKYAALAFKAEACLYEGTFRKYHGLGDHEAILRESVNAAEGVIKSGLFKVYSTGDPDDFYKMFVMEDLLNNPEGIMIERFIKDIRMNSNPNVLASQYAGYTKDFVQTFLCTDGLPIFLSSLYKGDAKFGDEFVNRDPRMRSSILTPDRPYKIDGNGIPAKINWPVWDFYCISSYFIIKHLPMITSELERCTFDHFIFRYGKLLVGYAEAKAELGECTQNILDISVNKLRDRVKMPHLTIAVGFKDPNWPNWEVPVSPLINEIRRERRIELCGEGNRWDDLVRWKAGKLIENPLTFKGARDPITGDYRVVYPGYTKRTWLDKLYLYPLPQQELTLNPSLKQNPGW